MQDEINEKVVALVVNNAKMGASELRRALEKYLADQKAKQPTGDVVKHGKQSIAKLMEQNTGLTNLEITDGNIKDFEKTARKYNIDFALKKDKAAEKPRYLVFFKARDADAMTAAFNAYSAEILAKNKRPSVLKTLHKLIDAVRDIPAKVVNRDKQREQSR